MKRNLGFSIIELMVVMSIAVILITLVAPSFTSLIRSNSITSAVNTFLADARFARSEAVRLGGRVVMCHSDAPEAATPVCGPSGTSWSSGWIIFQDKDKNNNFSAGDVLLRLQSPITNVNYIGNSTVQLPFTATGRLESLSGGVLSLQFGNTPVFSSKEQRTICIGLGGRASIAGDGSATCS